MAKQKYDLITIGDTVIDTFIRLHEASVHCNLKKHTCELCMSFANKIPYETLDVVPAVGNPSNVAVGAARLGLRTAILTAIGDDYPGKQILDVYTKEGVGSEFVKVNRGVITNQHFVLNFQAERTILIKHEKYEYYDPSVIGSARWIYFSSLPEHTLPYQHKLAAYLAKHPEIRMGFNPNTFQLRIGAKKLAAIYRNTYVLFVNREEAAKILETKSEGITTLFHGLHKLGPKIVVITDGPKGAYASDGTRAWFMPPYPDPAPPFSRTGAGDAFACTFFTALILGKSVKEALMWAPVNSMNVVRFTGAQKGLLTKPQLAAFIKKAPASYKPKEL